MEIIYSSKAKDDLARVDWRIREKIINDLKALSHNKKTLKNSLKEVFESDFTKLELQDHVVITDLSKDSLTIVSVIKKKRLKVPSQKNV